MTEQLLKGSENCTACNFGMRVQKIHNIQTYTTTFMWKGDSVEKIMGYLH